MTTVGAPAIAVPLPPPLPRTRRIRSLTSRMTPLAARKAAAASGLAKVFTNVFWNAAPTMPTGIVARMIIHASRSSGVVIDRVRSDEKNPRMIRSQSRRKNTIIAIAVATCSPTTNERYGDPGADTFRS